MKTENNIAARRSYSAAFFIMYYSSAARIVKPRDASTRSYSELNISRRATVRGFWRAFILRIDSSGNAAFLLACNSTYMALRIVAHIFILTRGAADVCGRLRALQPVSIRGACIGEPL